MVIVTKKRIQFFICSTILIFFTENSFALSDAEFCSKDELLRDECNYQNAVQKRDCLLKQLAKFSDCEQKVTTLDWQLVEKIKQKSNATMDPLKTEKAFALTKLKEFHQILEIHANNMRFTSANFVSFVKSFTNEYKTSESNLKSKLQKILKSASECEDHLDLINIRFSAENLFRDEKAKGSRVSQRASMYLLEFQDRSNALQDRLKAYSEFIDKNALNPSIPDYKKEMDLARGLEKYAVERVSRLEDNVRSLVQQINAKIVALEKKKIDSDKEKDFKLANDISKELEFHKYVVQLIDDAFLRTERSKVQNFEFFSDRFKGVQKFMTLDSLCTVDCLNQTGSNWLDWGCKRYEEYLPRAKKNLASSYASSIKRVLLNLSWDIPDLKESPEILDALAQNNLERAIMLYDQLLRSLN